MYLGHHFVEIRSQLVDTCPVFGGNEYARGVLLCDPAVFEFFEGVVFRLFGLKGELIVFFVAVCIDFIENYEYGLVYGVYVLESLFHYLYVFLEIRVGNVYYMHEYVSLPDFIQGALECFHELCGKFSYETYSIAQQKRNVFYDNFPYGRVQGGEQLVLGEYIAFCQKVHKSALADVGISYKGYTDK